MAVPPSSINISYIPALTNIHRSCTCTVRCMRLRNRVLLRRLHKGMSDWGRVLECKCYDSGNGSGSIQAARWTSAWAEDGVCILYVYWSGPRTRIPPTSPELTCLSFHSLFWVILQRGCFWKCFIQPLIQPNKTHPFMFFSYHYFIFVTRLCWPLRQSLVYCYLFCYVCFSSVQLQTLE